MRKLLILLFGVLVGLPALCQIADVQLKNNQVDGQNIKTIESVRRIWNNSKQLPAVPGFSYSWIAPGDTAYYLVPPANGDSVYITVIVSDVPDDGPPPVVLKQFINNSGGTYRDAAGAIVLPPVSNAYDVTKWNYFTKLVTPFPAWCDVFELKDCHHTFSTGFSVTYAFTGSRFELMGEKSNNKGKVNIKIDNGPDIMIDLYDPTTVNNSQVIYWADVPPGSHQVKVTNTGQKNPASSSTNFLTDGVKVYE